MGKTKIKTVDDSQIEESKKPARPAGGPVKKLGRSDDLVEKLKVELGMEETKAPEEKPAKEEPKAEKKETKKAQKPGKEKPRSEQSSRIRGKKYQEKVADLDKSQILKLEEAIEIVKKLSYSKFPGTLEAHINTISTGIRGTISLPYASGKKIKVAAFGKGAELSGADIVGDEKLLEDIKAGKINFDVLITTAEWMSKLAPLAKILGPRGLMPNPKNGTITDDLKGAVTSYQAGKTEYKTESKAPVIHLSLGKLNQPTEELTANVKILLQTLGKSRVKKVTLSPTMGPSVRLDLASI